MHPTKQSNTQVYSPLGSFVVEQHNPTARHEVIKQRYAREMYGQEKGIALVWLFLFIVLVGSSLYHRLGRAELSMAKADAAVATGTIPSPPNPSSD